MRGKLVSTRYLIDGPIMPDRKQQKLEKGSKINFDLITSFNERANEENKGDSCDRTKNRDEDNFGKILSIIDFENEDIKTENQTEKNKMRNKCTEHTAEN